MSDIRKKFEELKIQYELNGGNLESTINEVIDLIEDKEIDIDLKSDMIDFVSDVFIENRNYQSAYTLINNFVKKSVKHINPVFLLKLACVRMEAVLYDCPIIIKR